MAIGFTRAFKHEDWVDNVDRVQAAGDNGFNQRFRLLAADLDQIGTVVGQISTALDSLSAAPPPLELRASITPIITPIGTVGWELQPGFTQKVNGQTSATGMVGVQLPHGARILRFRAIGRNSGPGALRLELVRLSMTNPAATSELIARVVGTADPYEQTPTAAPALARVDNDAFKYYVNALLNGAGAADTVTIVGLQVVYATS